jgi:hypothetical protein
VIAIEIAGGAATAIVMLALAATVTAMAVSAARGATATDRVATVRIARSAPIGRPVDHVQIALVVRTSRRLPNCPSARRRSVSSRARRIATRCWPASTKRSVR